MKYIHFLSAALAFIALGTPFVWMEIGPEGYAYYGPGVPDIYILGGFILGKDISFWGISFAIVVQLVFILYFIVNCLRAAISKNNKKSFRLTLINSFLLLLFPCWLHNYVGGVVGNSDGADLTIHYHAGLFIYGLLVILNVVAIVKSLQPTRT